MVTRKTLHPKDFEVNQAWLAFRINAMPVRTPEGEHDIYVLQDAGSKYIFGTAFAPREAETPSQAKVLALMQQGWKAREEWPSELILPGRPSAGNEFARVAGWNGIHVRSVPESQLSLYIKDVQSSFEEHLSRNDPSDA